MFGPYPLFEDLGGGAGYMNPVTNDLFWLYAATYDSGSNLWSITIAQHVYLTGIINLTINTSMPGTGAPWGTVLEDANYYYVGFFTGPGAGCWYQIDRITGAQVADTGFIAGHAATWAYLDGLGNLVNIYGSGAVDVISTTSMNTVGTATLPKPCNRPGGSALVSPGLAWCRGMDGVSGTFSLLDTTIPASPTVTSFDLGFTFEADYVVYSSLNDEIIFWLDNNTIKRWSTVSHTVVLSVTHLGGYSYMGPIAGGLFAVGLDVYDPTTLNIVYTANGFNPDLPGWQNIGNNFGHFFDGNNVIWLKVNSEFVYGALVGILRLLCASGDAQFGVPYDSFLVASGTVPPYTYAIISGSLPHGLTLNEVTGEISGIPSEVGTFPYTAQVTDSLDNTATSSCVIVVAAPGPPGPPSPCGCLPTLEITLDLDADWGDKSTFYLTQDEPFPFTVRGLVWRLTENND